MFTDHAANPVELVLPKEVECVPPVSFLIAGCFQLSQFCVMHFHAQRVRKITLTMFAIKNTVKKSFRIKLITENLVVWPFKVTKKDIA